MKKYFSGFQNYLREELKKWVTRTFLAGLLYTLVFLFTPVSDKIKELWSIPDRLTEIEIQITGLEEATKSLAGEDRVIRQTSGLSYVIEPVHKGEHVNLVIVAEKTQLGETCVLQESQGIFTDESRIATPGYRPKYARKRDVGSTSSAMKVELVPPHNLQPGRVEVYLLLEYECNGKTIFDRTDTLTYELLPESAKAN